MPKPQCLLFVLKRSCIYCYVICMTLPFKQSEHDFFHDYHWILKQSGHHRILKQSRHDFSGKHLCDGYCMNVMWCLYVEVTIYGFVKLSVRICYVNLFECKGPWMLKTYKLPCVEQSITKLDWKSTMYSVVKLISYFCV